MLFLAHFCGCIWNLMAVLEIYYEKKDTWLEFNNLTTNIWYEMYINSLFYAVSTMVTVGVMNLKNPLEKLVSIFILIALSTFFAYTIGGIGVIVQNMFKSDRELKY